MALLFLLKCFLIGISAASAMGPIFVLTCNNSAVKGFLRGFFTGLGAAIGDGVLILLGFFGILSIFGTSHQYQVVIDCVGGFLLFIVGISMIISRKNLQAKPSSSADTLVLTATKTFLSTVFNPLTILFFMFISTQVLAAATTHLRMVHLIAGSVMTALGSLSILTIVAYVASKLGNVISYKTLRLISIVTGTVVLGIGGYFFVDAIKVLMSLR